MDAGSTTGDSSPIRLLIVIFFLILGGGYFAGSETSLASCNRIRMMSYADDGNRRAKRVLYLLDNFDKALTTILIGNNLMHIGCASLAALMAIEMWGDGATAATSIVTTLVVFLLSEMIPKAFAKACSERFALAIAGSMVVLTKLLTPISAVFSGLSRLVQKPFGPIPEDEPTVSEDELHDIIERIDEEGDMSEDASELVQSALEFTETEVREVITPWNRVISISLEMAPEEIREIILEHHLSRLPVMEGDEVVGILQTRKYLRSLVSGKVPDPRKLMTAPRFVPEGMPIDELMDTLTHERIHMAVVKSREGKYTGIVTIEDMVEEIVGEIYDEGDAEDGTI